MADRDTMVREVKTWQQKSPGHSKSWCCFVLERGSRDFSIQPHDDGMLLEFLLLTRSGEIDLDQEAPEGLGQGKGKSGGDWSTNGKGGAGHELPRTRISDEKVGGVVSAWKGKYGWILPNEKIRHEKAAWHKGSLWFRIDDLEGGSDALLQGTPVLFHISEDPKGLGAEEVEATGTQGHTSAAGNGVAAGGQAKGNGDGKGDGNRGTVLTPLEERQKATSSDRFDGGGQVDHAQLVVDFVQKWNFEEEHRIFLMKLPQGVTLEALEFDPRGGHDGNSWNRLFMFALGILSSHKRWDGGSFKKFKKKLERPRKEEAQKRIELIVMRCEPPDLDDAFDKVKQVILDETGHIPDTVVDVAFARRRWFPHPKLRPCPPEANIIRVLTFNLLGENLARGSDSISNSYQYPCKQQYLNFDHRFPLLSAVYSEHKPDIMGFQELTLLALDSRNPQEFRWSAKLKKQGYCGWHAKKISTSRTCDGVALLWKPKKFAPLGGPLAWKLGNCHIALAQVLQMRDPLRQVCKYWLMGPSRCNSMKRDGQCKFLHDLPPVNDRKILAVCTHLVAGNTPAAESERRDQAVKLLDRIKEIGLPAVIMADLNGSTVSRPGVGVPLAALALISEGCRSAFAEVTGKEPDFTQYAVWKKSEDTIERGSAIDYVLCFGDELQPRRVLEMPTREKVEAFPDRLPNQWYPSDHLTVVADIEVTSAGGQYKLGVHDDDIELTELGCPRQEAAVRVATTACGPARRA